MGKKVYTKAVKFLRDVTKIDFFGWVDEDYYVDAVAYIPISDWQKLSSLQILPEQIRSQMSLTFLPSFIRICVPKINCSPMVDDLVNFLRIVTISKQESQLTERRLLRIATVSMPTGSFSKQLPRSIDEQASLFYKHVEAAFKLISANGALNPDEAVICVMPEFYNHCRYDDRNKLFMPYAVQQELLQEYCRVSQNFPAMLIMVNITAMTSDVVNDEEGATIGHKPKQQKTNMLIGIKNGEVVYISHKINKGPADIPESELLSSEAERNTYYQAPINEKLMKLKYLRQFKGITFSASVCIDAQEGVVGKYLSKQFPDFNEDDFGPAIQIISSSSMALPLFKKRDEILSTQVITPKIGQGLIIQADGHSQLKRSGVWLIDGNEFIQQAANVSIQLENDARIEAYTIGLNLLHNKLHEVVGDDIDGMGLKFNTLS